MSWARCTLLPEMDCCFAVAAAHLAKELIGSCDSLCMYRMLVNLAGAIRLFRSDD